MSFKFPKQARLRRREEFLKIHQSKDFFLGTLVVLTYRMGNGTSPRLGLTVTKKLGKAHDRNRFKRCARELFRHYIGSLHPGLEIELRPRKKLIEIPLSLLREEIKTLLRNASDEAQRRTEKSRPGS